MKPGVFYSPMDRTLVLHMILDSFRFDFKVLTRVLKKDTLEISFILPFFSEKAFFSLNRDD